VPLYTLVRRFIKTGIGFLFVGLSLGAWLLVRRELMGVWPHPHLVSAHTHAVQVGFVMFLIFGVALWLFPRPPKDDRRYTPGRVAAAYWILTLATGGRFIAEVARAWSDAPLWAWVVVAGGLGQVAGAAIYFWTMWPRVRSVGSHLREARGEKF
jgi:cbb3-type cytochrome oxidase subunit 1